ncbi:hypothetical protein ACH5RR_037055 [Cinchona calisaya]|uniref:Uncharacterized protein n=1 Tax=Cinchona calisaya TaxID=153742 RepID=A0ABD2Y6E6_9GENT
MEPGMSSTHHKVKQKKMNSIGTIQAVQGQVGGIGPMDKVGGAQDEDFQESHHGGADDELDVEDINEVDDKA